MGNQQSQKRNSTSDSSDRTEDSKRTPRTWREHRKEFLNSLSHGPPIAVQHSDIPLDNIFVPIQADDILPQIPIGNHHPAPRTGIEDNDLCTLHTNSFYANAFLDAQTQPIWTHPYSVWWGRGSQDLGVLQTWGINVAQADEDDFQHGPGKPPKVSCRQISETHIDIVVRSFQALTSSV